MSVFVGIKIYTYCPINEKVIRDIPVIIFNVCAKFKSWTWRGNGSAICFFCLWWPVGVSYDFLFSSYFSFSESVVEIVSLDNPYNCKQSLDF